MLLLHAMRYRTFPVAHPSATPTRGDEPRVGKPRRRLRIPWTVLGGLFVVGGLVRLAINSDPVEVASGDLTWGATQAAASDHTPEPATGSPAASPETNDPPTKRDGTRPHLDAMDAAIVSMLLNR
jgi:hypothetical protein